MLFAAENNVKRKCLIAAAGGGGDELAACIGVGIGEFAMLVARNWRE